MKTNNSFPSRQTPVQIAARSAAIVAAGQVLWLLALYPLIPATGQGWLAAMAAGLTVTFWAALCISALLWLRQQRRHPRAFKAIGVALAVSLGAGIFASAYEARAFISANASYFGR